MLVAIDDFCQDGDLEVARGILKEVVEGLNVHEFASDEAEINLLLALDARGLALGSLEEQQVLREGVLMARTRLLPKDHPDVLMSMGALANVRFALGEHEGAGELFEELLEIQTRRLPSDHPDVIQPKGSLANVKFVLGDLEGARELHEQVLEAWTGLLPDNHFKILNAKQNLAVSKKCMGDLEGARELEEEVHETWTQSLERDHPELIGIKANLAVTQMQLRDFEGARLLQQEVLRARQRLLPKGHPKLLEAKLNLATLLAGLNDLVGARDLQEQVLEAYADNLPQDHPTLIAAKENLVGTMMGLGDLEHARELEEQVFEARTRLLHPNHPNLFITMENLAFLKKAQGDPEGARKLVADLLAGMRVRACSLRYDSPRAARERARFELRRLLGQGLSNHLGSSQGRLESMFFSTLECLRMVSVSGPDLALAVRNRPELVSIRDQVAALRSEIHDLSASVPEATEELVEWWTRLRDLTQERDSAEYKLRQGLTTTGEGVDEIDAARIASHLGEGEAAISYLRYLRRFGKRPDVDGKPKAVDWFCAFLVHRTGAVERVELGPAADLEQLVNTWRASIGKPLGARGIGLEAGTDLASSMDGRESGLVLRQWIVDPILERLRGEPPSVLYVVVDDVLHLVPVDGLPWDAESNVGDRIEVQSEVSFQRLVAPQRAPSPVREFVALGGVDFDEIARPTDKEYRNPSTKAPREPTASLVNARTPPVSERSGSLMAFGQLPATSEEIILIGSRFEESFGIKPLLLKGGAATKEALNAHAPQARFLHVATHGWFAPEKFKSQLDTITDQRTRSLFERAQETLIGFAPETLCGLALAGANLGRDAVGRIPGIITAEELSMLDLRNCELAVLSACETNAGIRRAGQGIQSLQSALHAAGARTAITSLWKVDDAATRRLMELFYTKLWKDKLGKADALWEAKMALREEGHPVRDWAGWVLTGDPD